MKSLTRPLVVIPAYNEAARLGRVLQGVRAADPSLAILVVDDGSTDDTAGVARAAGARVVRLPFNMGAGVAAQTGYKFALAEGYDCLVQLDADGQHEPADIPALLGVVVRGEADVAIGSRFLGRGDYRVGALRGVGMGLFRLLAYVMTGVRFSDVTSGFQALNRDLLRFFIDERYPVDYPDADVLIMLHRAGFRVQEVPVRMYPKNGASMHAGLKPLYYVYRMLLAIALMPLRAEARSSANPGVGR